MEGKSFFAEMLGTMLLMFNVLSTIDIPIEGGGPLGVYPIAMSVMVSHLFLIPIDGCSINPSRSFGPSLVAAWAHINGNYFHQQYMFWLGPLFGAGLAAFVYEYGPLKPENFAGKGDMTDAIHMGNKGLKKQGKQEATDYASNTIQYEEANSEVATRSYSKVTSNPMHNLDD